MEGDHARGERDAAASGRTEMHSSMLSEGTRPHKILAAVVLTTAIVFVVLVVMSSTGHQSSSLRWGASKFARKDPTIFVAGTLASRERDSIQADPTVMGSPPWATARRADARQASVGADSGGKLQHEEAVCEGHETFMSQRSTSCGSGAASATSCEESSKDNAGTVYYALDADSDSEGHAADASAQLRDCDAHGWY